MSSSKSVMSTTASSAVKTAIRNSASATTCTAFIPALDESRLKVIQEATGATLTPLEPLGAAVQGLDLKGPRPNQEVMAALELEMAHRGFLVFKQQYNMTTEDLVEATQWWGGRAMHSTHGVHPATPPGPAKRHIFRLSNDRSHGILGVGPQWHNDGSFEEAPFSHVAYHILETGGGGTHFCHQGAAFDALPKDVQNFWSRLTSVNSNTGVAHPVVHEHYLSQRKSVWLHMGMTGAVLEKTTEDGSFRLLNQDEMKELFNKYNDLLNQGFEQGYAIQYDYEEGDVLFIDNYAVGHRASPEAHQPSKDVGLRILHRATGKAPFQGFEPHFGLHQYMDIHGPNPFSNSDNEGVWIGGGIGFRYDPTLHYQN